MAVGGKQITLPSPKCPKRRPGAGARPDGAEVDRRVPAPAHGLAGGPLDRAADAVPQRRRHLLALVGHVTDRTWRAQVPVPAGCVAIGRRAPVPSEAWLLRHERAHDRPGDRRDALGRVAGERAGAVCAFRGVPFAAPPVGPLRFEPPARPAAVGRRATDDGAPGRSPRRSAVPLDQYLGTGDQPIGEDCLTLNVWTPACDDGRRPVLVWIHGGAFVTGAASAPWYDGAAMAANGDVVVVTAQLPARRARLHVPGRPRRWHAASGNLGLLDQLAALQWVQDHAARFGGEPGERHDLRRVGRRHQRGGAARRAGQPMACSTGPSSRARRSASCGRRRRAGHAAARAARPRSALEAAPTSTASASLPRRRAARRPAARCSSTRWRGSPPSARWPTASSSLRASTACSTPPPADAVPGADRHRARRDAAVHRPRPDLPAPRRRRAAGAGRRRARRGRARPPWPPTARPGPAPRPASSRRRSPPTTASGCRPSASPRPGWRRDARRGCTGSRGRRRPSAACSAPATASSCRSCSTTSHQPGVERPDRHGPERGAAGRHRAGAPGCAIARAGRPGLAGLRPAPTARRCASTCRVRRGRRPGGRPAPAVGPAL